MHAHAAAFDRQVIPCLRSLRQAGFWMVVLFEIALWLFHAAILVVFANVHIALL